MTSTGAINAQHDSLSPLGGMVTVFDMVLGEVAPGGVGSGLYGMLVLAVVAVFVAGPMVGRTPEYLGTKLGRREMTLASLYILTTPAIVLVGTAVALATPAGAGMLNDGPHGLTEDSPRSPPPATTARRSPGGDRSAVTGGTTVLSDRVVVQITSREETFVDRMIALVEGASRQKTPNETALNTLLSHRGAVRRRPGAQPGPGPDPRLTDT